MGRPDGGQAAGFMVTAGKSNGTSRDVHVFGEHGGRDVRQDIDDLHVVEAGGAQGSHVGVAFTWSRASDHLERDA